jgi:regulator of RNase E activity RraA
LSGITPGHGNMAIHAVNVPVTIAGMDVAPGELIHMDENGAVKFPADRLEDVLTNVRKLRDQEAERMAAMQKATSLKEVRAIMSGHTYTKKE